MKLIIGIIITAIWIGFFVWYGLENNFTALPLNEFGDFVAGVVAPLAFFWFILAYLLQKEELSKNTSALEQQQQELQKQFGAMKSQAEALKQAANSLSEYSRPYLSAHIELKGEQESIYLIVQNFGIRPAHNVKFKFDPPLSEFSRYPEMSYEDFISLNFIPPEYKQEYFINSRIQLISKDDEVRWETNVTVNYFDSNGNSYEENYTLEFFEAKKKIYQKLPTVEESLKNLSVGIKDLTADYTTRLLKLVTETKKGEEDV